MILDFVDISFGGQSLQMRPSQLTTTNIAKAFRLIPDTIILIYDRETVALPTDGVFDDDAIHGQLKVTKQLQAAEALLGLVLVLNLRCSSVKRQVRDVNLNHTVGIIFFFWKLSTIKL